MSESAAAPQILTQLGFSETEALTYCELLRSPGATGYKVAKAIGKSQANVYAALAGLSAKGAILVEKGEIRAYRAISTAELLPRLSKEFHDKCAAAEAALLNVAAPAPDDNIYHLANESQVYERARNMCDRARGSITFELFHRPFGRLTAALSDAVNRGVGVAGVTFDADDDIPGATCVLSLKAARADLWPGDQLSLVTDAQEALVALFDRSSQAVLHAVYTDSTYLACLLHAAAVDATILNKHIPPEIGGSFNKRLFGTIPEGFLRLIAEGDGASAGRDPKNRR